MRQIKSERPIFIIGHARGGTTVLSAILNWHHDIGTNYNKDIYSYRHINQFINDLLSYNFHLEYSERLERKCLWFSYFPTGKETFAGVGKEMIIEKLMLNNDSIVKFKTLLLKDVSNFRYLSKSPGNSFRIKVIKEMFPDAIFIAVFRKLEEVVFSWGLRSYGFKLLGYDEAIRIFSRKWYEVYEYIETLKKEYNILIVTYDELISNTTKILKKIFVHCRLSDSDFIKDIALTDNRNKWKNDKQYKKKIIEQKDNLGE